MAGVEFLYSISIGAEEIGFDKLYTNDFPAPFFCFTLALFGVLFRCSQPYSMAGS